MRGTFDNEIKGAIAQAKKPFNKGKKGSVFAGKKSKSAPAVGGMMDDNDGDEGNMSKPAVTPKQSAGLRAAGGFKKNGPAEVTKGASMNRRSGIY